MSLSTRIRGRAAASLLAMGVTGGAATAATAAQPEPWQMTFQPAATPIMTHVEAFNDLLMAVIVSIVVIVFGLLGYALFRFRASANPTPSTTTHNTLIEVLWTAVPVLILVMIAIPSYRLLYFIDRVPDAAMTIKAIGHQWYWSYEYPDQGFTFDSLLVPDDELAPGQPRLLTTDTAVVVPVNTTVRVLTTADDVIHSWAVPSFGIKVDSIPGRLNEAWFRVAETGTYYGQCSELCGVNHGFMPIMVKVVSKPEFEAWVKKAKKEFASLDGPPATVARASD